MNQYVAEVLKRHQAMDAEELDAAVSKADDGGFELIDVLRATDAIEEGVLVRALAAEMGMEFIEKIDADATPDDVIEAVPINFARQHHIVPIGERGDEIIVAVSNPLDPFPLDDLRALLGRPIDAVASTRESIDDAINRVYERKEEASLAEAKEGADVVEELQDIIDQTDEAPVIKWVNDLFYRAVNERVSDIHIEPTDEKVIVRFRIDGRLVKRKEAHKGNLSSIVARVKIEAGLNIAEKRLPQDGRITKKIRGKVIDVRVSTIPTAKGERVVMRILDKENIMLDLTDLGFAKRDLDILLHTIHRPNGIMLVTGPTGSGKTTTLYASLNKINTPEKNILTAEDPVEYELRGIGQLHVKPKIGLNFAKALRAFLRQDPDVIMVGEIRDHETADIAIHASLTGHLVLSTLHTNDAPGAITRLIEMGVKPFQISSSLLAVLAQRLVRRLCPHCKLSYIAREEDLIELGIDLEHVDETLAKLRAVAATSVMGRNSSVPPAPPEHADEMELRAEDLFEESLNLIEDEPTALHRLPAAAETGMPTFFKPDPAGCEECGQTGYRGRMGIYELMVIDEPVRKAVLANSDAKTIQRAARSQGMRTLREDGARQVIAGVTSVDEVLAATQAVELEAAE